MQLEYPGLSCVSCKQQFRFPSPHTVGSGCRDAPGLHDSGCHDQRCVPGFIRAFRVNALVEKQLHYLRELPSTMLLPRRNIWDLSQRPFREATRQYPGIPRLGWVILLASNQGVINYILLYLENTRIRYRTLAVS